jgi:hypothetical protein
MLLRFSVTQISLRWRRRDIASVDVLASYMSSATSLNKTKVKVMVF